ncbi:MAG: Fic family protein [Steroidobacteraceae bacterium]
MDSAPKAADKAVNAPVLRLIAALDEFKGAWRAIGRIAPDRLTALRRVATIESAASSTRIEGSKLSNREVARLLSNINIKSFASRDEQEVAGYAAVMETVFDHWQDLTLTENHIRQLHRDLLQHSTKDERHRGAYKTLRNDVVALDETGKEIGVVFETASPFDTPRMMTDLVSWADGALRDGKLHPLIIIAIFIVSLLAIHPFQDGNGRLSRVLTTLLLLRGGYAHVPYSSLESVVEQTKERYYLALRQTQGTMRTDEPNWHPWLEYFLGALSEQKTRLERKLESERLLLGELPELSVHIMELARERGRVAVTDVVKATNASRNTIKYHFAALVEGNLLVLRGAGRGAYYTLQ